jgi:hypothetical protein
VNCVSSKRKLKLSLLKRVSHLLLVKLCFMYTTQFVFCCAQPGTECLSRVSHMSHKAEPSRWMNLTLESWPVMFLQKHPAERVSTHL